MFMCCVWGSPGLEPEVPESTTQSEDPALSDAGLEFAIEGDAGGDDAMAPPGDGEASLHSAVPFPLTSEHAHANTIPRVLLWGCLSLVCGAGAA